MFDSGLSIRVPNDQYVVPFVEWDENGARKFNTSRREVLISRVADNPATLGRYFLTSAYLMVHQDDQTFTLWQANPSTNSQLVSVASQKDGDTCTNSTTAGSASGSAATPSSSSTTANGKDSSTPTALIAGSTAAGIVLLVIAGILVFYLRRRQKRHLTQTERSRPASEMPATFRKFELHNESSSRLSPSYTTDPSSAGGSLRGSKVAELYSAPTARAEMGRWSGRPVIYEMGGGTPPLPPPKQ